MHKNLFLLLPLLLCLSGCTTAFEVGEALNKATSNIANNPKVLWDTVEPASAPAATTTAEPVAVPQPASAPAAASPEPNTQLPEVAK
jgi:hypothetical protein